jgi:hypothetical protein
MHWNTHQSYLYLTLFNVRCRKGSKNISRNQTHSRVNIVLYIVRENKPELEALEVLNKLSTLCLCFRPIRCVLANKTLFPEQSHPNPLYFLKFLIKTSIKIAILMYITQNTSTGGLWWISHAVVMEEIMLQDRYVITHTEASSSRAIGWMRLKIECGSK